MTDQAAERIQKDISENDIVLYMKGTRQLPQCGFSATVVQVMERLGVSDYKDINVLADQEIREGVKQFSNWPTIPQLYVKGEFVGGCDIIREMYQSGELEEMLKAKGISTKAA